MKCIDENSNMKSSLTSPGAGIHVDFRTPSVLVLSTFVISLDFSFPGQPIRDIQIQLGYCYLEMHIKGAKIAMVCSLSFFLAF